MTAPGPGLRYALITARGEAAIAVVRVRGAGLAEALGRIFMPRSAAPLLPGQVRVGSLVGEGGRVIDDAVVRLRGIGDGIEAEIAIHGSLFAAARVEELLRGLGAVPLEEHEAWEQGSLAGLDPRDRILAEGREALLASFAGLQASFFLGVLEGRLSREVRSLEDSIAAGGAREAGAAVLARIEVLLARGPFGRAMARPPEAVVAGVPNAGKSTLFNALLGEDRTIVSPEPGTTRDAVSEPCVLSGLPFRLTDSAGIRASSDPVERLGVDRARAAAASADIVLVLIDPQTELGAQLAIAEASGPRSRRVVVVSKADLGAARAVLDEPGVAALGATAVSAVTGEGLAALRDRIVAASAFGGTTFVRQTAPFLARHEDALAAARGAVRDGAPPLHAAAVLRSLRLPGGDP